MMGQAMETDEADLATLQAHASDGQPPSVGGAGSEEGGGGHEGDTKMAGAYDWPLKQRWQLPGEIPHLTRLLEAQA